MGGEGVARLPPWAARILWVRLPGGSCPPFLLLVLSLGWVRWVCPPPLPWAWSSTWTYCPSPVVPSTFSRRRTASPSSCAPWSCSKVGQTGRRGSEPSACRPTGSSPPLPADARHGRAACADRRENGLCSEETTASLISCVFLKSLDLCLVNTKHSLKTGQEGAGQIESIGGCG